MERSQSCFGKKFCEKLLVEIWNLCHSDLIAFHQLKLTFSSLMWVQICNAFFWAVSFSIFPSIKWFFLLLFEDAAELWKFRDFAKFHFSGSTTESALHWKWHNSFFWRRKKQHILLLLHFPCVHWSVQELMLTVVVQSGKQFKSKFCKEGGWLDQATFLRTAGSHPVSFSIRAAMNVDCVGVQQCISTEQFSATMHCRIELISLTRPLALVHILSTWLEGAKEKVIPLQAIDGELCAQECQNLHTDSAAVAMHQSDACGWQCTRKKATKLTSRLLDIRVCSDFWQKIEAQNNTTSCTENCSVLQAKVSQSWHWEWTALCDKRCWMNPIMQDWEGQKACNMLLCHFQGNPFCSTATDPSTTTMISLCEVHVPHVKRLSFSKMMGHAIGWMSCTEISCKDEKETTAMSQEVWQHVLSSQSSVTILTSNHADTKFCLLCCCLSQGKNEKKYYNDFMLSMCQSRCHKSQRFWSEES